MTSENKQFWLIIFSTNSTILSIYEFHILMKLISTVKNFKGTQTREQWKYFSLLLSFRTISLINFLIWVVLMRTEMFPCFVTFLVFSQITQQLCVLCVFIWFIPLPLPLRDCDHQDENSAQWVRGETFHLCASTLHYTLQHLRKLYFSINQISSSSNPHLIRKNELKVILWISLNDHIFSANFHLL